MHLIEDEILINCPVQKTFGFFMDLKKIIQSFPDAEQLENVSGGFVGMGTNLLFTLKIDGKPVSSIITIKEFEPEKKISVENDRISSLEIYSYGFEALGRKTKISFKGDITFHAFDEFIQNQISEEINKRNRQHLELIKQLLEIHV
jgi:hypothetical protein